MSTPTEASIRAAGQATINELSRLIWSVNRDDLARDRAAGTEESLFSIRSIRDRYEKAARAVVLWAADADPATLAAAAAVAREESGQ